MNLNDDLFRVHLGAILLRAVFILVPQMAKDYGCVGVLVDAKSAVCRLLIFDGLHFPLPQILGRATTQHFFNPCDLLKADARSEYRPEYRQRQVGGGWKLKKAGSCGT